MGHYTFRKRGLIESSSRRQPGQSTTELKIYLDRSCIKTVLRREHYKSVWHQSTRDIATAKERKWFCFLPAVSGTSISVKYTV